MTARWDIVTKNALTKTVLSMIVIDQYLFKSKVFFVIKNGYMHFRMNLRIAFFGGIKKWVNFIPK